MLGSSVDTAVVELCHAKVPDYLTEKIQSVSEEKEEERKYISQGNLRIIFLENGYIIDAERNKDADYAESINNVKKENLNRF